MRYKCAYWQFFKGLDLRTHPSFWSIHCFQPPVKCRAIMFFLENRDGRKNLTTLLTKLIFKCQVLKFGWHKLTLTCKITGCRILSCQFHLFYQALWYKFLSLLCAWKIGEGPFTKYPHQLTAVSEKVFTLLSRFWLCHLFVIQLLSTPSFEILSNQRAKSVTWIKNIVAIPFRLRIWLDAAIRHELSPFNLVKISRIWNRFRALFVLMKS